MHLSHCIRPLKIKQEDSLSSFLLFDLGGMRRDREHRSNIAVTLHSTLKIKQEDGRKE